MSESKLLLPSQKLRSLLLFAFYADLTVFHIFLAAFFYIRVGRSDETCTYISRGRFICIGLYIRYIILS